MGLVEHTAQFLPLITYSRYIKALKNLTDNLSSGLLSMVADHVL